MRRWILLLGIVGVLVAAGVPADEAIREVRRARSERAIETEGQEAFVRRYEAD